MDDAGIVLKHKPMNEDLQQTEILHRPLHKTLKTKEQRNHVHIEDHTNTPLHAFRTCEDEAEEHDHCKVFTDRDRYRNHTQEEKGEILHSPLERTLKVGTKSTDHQANGSLMTGQVITPKNARFTSLAKIVNHLRTVNKSKELQILNVHVQGDGEPREHSPVHDAVATRNVSAGDYHNNEETNILSPSLSFSNPIDMDSRPDHDATGYQGQLKSARKKDTSDTSRPDKRKHRTKETEKCCGQSVGSNLADKRCLIVKNLVVGEACVASVTDSHVPEKPLSPPGQQCAVCKEYVPQASLNSHRCKVGASRAKKVQNISETESFKNSLSKGPEPSSSGQDTAFQKQDHARDYTEVADQSKNVIATGNLSAPVVGGVYKCDHCEQSFNSRGNLSLHLLSHVKVKIHSCNECDRTFRTENMLVTHKRIHAGQHPYQCNICARTFNKSNTLTCHLRTHSGEKPYQCNLCDKSFTQNSALTVHKRIHSGEEPFRCELCGKTFRDKSNLRRHVRTHSGDQPFECSVCGKRFSTKDHLNTHFRIHTGDRPYQCNMCEKAFRQSSTLVGHMRIHTGELPYKCDICQKGFRDRSNCSSHMKLHAQYSAKSKATGSNI